MARGQKKMGQLQLRGDRGIKSAGAKYGQSSYQSDKEEKAFAAASAKWLSTAAIMVELRDRVHFYRNHKYFFAAAQLNEFLNRVEPLLSQIPPAPAELGIPHPALENVRKGDG